MPYSTVLQVLEDEYGRPVDEIFDHIDATPLGSASLAQVHRAKLTSGEDVAIKVQRPGVRNHGAGCVHHAFHRQSGHRGPCTAHRWWTLSGVVEELWDTFESKPTSWWKARNLSEFNRFCERYKYMDCPKPYIDLCTEHVVVMDYVEGIFSHPDQLLEAGYDLKEIGTKLVDNYPRELLTKLLPCGSAPRQHHGERRADRVASTWHDRPAEREDPLLKDMIFAVAEQDSPALADGLLRFAGARPIRRITRRCLPIWM